MKEFKGTKGEWKDKEQIFPDGTSIVITGQYYDVAILTGIKENLDIGEWDEIKANAQVIKTATGLLKALQELVLQVKAYSKGYSDTAEYFKSEIEQAEKAINKALGL